MDQSSESPCGICFKNCAEGSHSILCEICGNWFHGTCEKLKEESIMELGNLSQASYICRKCSSEDDGSFDFLTALHRLRRSAKKNWGIFCACTIREKHIMPYFISHEKDITKYHTSTDRHSLDILRKHGLEKGKRPLKTTADGNCLFNAVSLLLNDSEDMANELRTRTCIEMVNNEDEYIQSDMGRVVCHVSPDYREACVDCTRIGAFSSAWTIMALSNIIKRQVNMLYPPVNGTRDLYPKFLSNCIKPREIVGVDLWIMWTTTELTMTSDWIPNHFVPLVEETEFNPGALHSTPVKEALNTIPDSPGVTPFKFGKLNFDETSSDTSIGFDQINFEFGWDISDDSDDSADAFEPKKMRATTPITTSSPSTAFESSNDEREIQLSGRFLAPNELYTTMLAEVIAEKEIPTGPKSNIGFVVQLGKNNKKNFVPDDCGAWCGVKAGSTRAYFLIEENGNLKFVRKDKDGFYTEKKSGGKFRKEHVRPMPDTQDILILHRVYSKLKANTNYRKRVSWFRGYDGSCIGEGKAVVEYLGAFPKQPMPPHGNTKRNKREYVRTPPGVVKNIDDHVQSRMSTREIYKKMIGEDSIHAPRDYRQVRYRKMHAKKDSWGTEGSRTFADGVLDVLSMVQTDDFVREAAVIKGSPPCVILYTNNQLADLKRIASTTSDKTILGVDRTFNLGACYATIIVYKQSKVVRNSTGENPIILGPIYLHWDGKFTTYCHFFSHLSSRISTTAFTSEIRIGSDNEFALTKALDKCFPGVQRFLCTRHLIQNVQRLLRTKGSISEESKKMLLSSLFRDDGIARAVSNEEFETKSVECKRLISKFPEDIKRYITAQIMPLLAEYVVKLRNGLMQKALWTNNNSESMNNLIKVDIDWKPQKLPQLIKKFKDHAILQYTDMRRAIHGRGNYSLSSRFKKYSYSNAVWREMGEGQKEKIFQKLIFEKDRSHIPLENEMEEASNPAFLCPRKSHIARKPGQKKGTRAERAAKK
ncbi:uncharacterized protein LOC120325535 [Styela clava]